MKISGHTGRNIIIRDMLEKPFGFVGLYGISTIVGYLMPNPLYTYPQWVS